MWVIPLWKIELGEDEETFLVLVEVVLHHHLEVDFNRKVQSIALFGSELLKGN